jgi:hypothetical protein
LKEEEDMDHLLDHHWKLLQNSEPPRWKHFQYQEHSLCINASSIAACAGFHPYRSLVKLLMEHIYQGSSGQALLRHMTSNSWD